jgi:hypothetical protein
VKTCLGRLLLLGLFAIPVWAQAESAEWVKLIQAPKVGTIFISPASIKKSSDGAATVLVRKVFDGKPYLITADNKKRPMASQESIYAMNCKAQTVAGAIAMKAFDSKGNVIAERTLELASLQPMALSAISPNERKLFDTVCQPSTTN